MEECETFQIEVGLKGLSGILDTAGIDGMIGWDIVFIGSVGIQVGIPYVKELV